TQGAAPCSYSLSATSASPTYTGGSATVGVISISGCSWTAVSNVSWISVVSGASGSGNGTVTYSVAVNNATTSRTGTITIAGKTFTVTQAGK
ncbi:MAG: BACON domain-containing protein, partial [Syntrophobacteraceae bacterium]